MSSYSLLPPPQRTHDYAFWENNFSIDEINQIRTLGDKLASQDAVVGVGELAPEIRHSRVGWMPLTNETQWIYDRLAWIARRLNGQYFQFDVEGFGEDLQYTVYGADNGHYGWHVDMGRMSEIPRKLSMVLLLSDPDEYEGGDLQMRTGPEPVTLDRRQGMVHAFPSYVLHQVTPVTRGTRRSLVVWLCGPQFR